MANNLYKVGDWVYCEISAYQPYVVRRIEELTKTPCGNVEAKVICAWRRRDIPSSIVSTIERPQSKKDKENAAANGTNDLTIELNNFFNTSEYDVIDMQELNETQKYLLRHRELFYSKYTDTIPVTTIRGKCSVLLYCADVEKYQDYLTHDDTFYYHLTYDPYQRTIVADRGEIKVGMKYQAEVPAILTQAQISELEQKNKKFEELKWNPLNSLNEREIEQFLTIAKSVGTFARALDCNNAFKQPSLPLSAAAASRDITLFHAMNALHEHNYNIGKAALSLVTTIGPIICKDEMEDWSAAEANIFEDALDKYGKDFSEIRKDFLPWKTLKSIIEYYYTWKTTDRYVQQKRIKSTEQESKLKQVYIPNHTKQNQSALLKNSHMSILQNNDIQLKPCESCGTSQSQQWYLYNPLQIVIGLLHNQPQQIKVDKNEGNLQSRLCSECWIYWKKHGGFKYPRPDRSQIKPQSYKCTVLGCTKEFKSKQLLAKHYASSHGYLLRSGSPKPATMRNRQSFYLLTTPLTQASRFVCKCLSNLKKYARKPSKQIDFPEINKEWEKEPRNIKQILENGKKDYIKIYKQKLNKDLLHKIYKFSKLKKLNPNMKSLKSDFENGVSDADIQSDYDEFRKETQCEYFNYFENKCSTPAYTPEKILYPRPTDDVISKFHLNLMSQARKRTHEQSENSNSNDTSPSSKRSLITKPQSLIKSQTKQPAKSLKPIQSIHLLNAPDDLYYKVTKKIKTIRQDIDLEQLKKLARTPFKTLKQYQNQYATISKIWITSAAAHASTLTTNSTGKAINLTNKQQNGLDLSTNNSNGIENNNGETNNHTVNIPPPTTPPPPPKSANGEVVVLD